MELRHLRYFLAVAEERNFTRAAERLGVAQPPLSRQIRQLEEELGVVLLDRECRPLALTPAGRMVFEQAALVVESVARLKTLARRLVEGERRRFVLGFVGSALYGPAPAMIRRFKDAAPHVDVSLAEMTTLEQIAALKEGRIDVGIGRIRFDDPAIRREVLVEEPLLAALPVVHRLAGSEEPVGLAELAKETLILYPRSPRPGYADQVLSIFRDHRIEPSLVSEARELQTALGLVTAGEGVCLVPHSVRRLRGGEVTYRALRESGATSPVILSWREGDVSAETSLMQRISHELFTPGDGDSPGEWQGIP